MMINEGMMITEGLKQLISKEVVVLQGNRRYLGKLITFVDEYVVLEDAEIDGFKTIGEMVIRNYDAFHSNERRG